MSFYSTWAGLVTLNLVHAICENRFSHLHSIFTMYASFSFPSAGSLKNKNSGTHLYAKCFSFITCGDSDTYGWIGSPPDTGSLWRCLALHWEGQPWSGWTVAPEKEPYQCIAFTYWFFFPWVQIKECIFEVPDFCIKFCVCVVRR